MSTDPQTSSFYARNAQRLSGFYSGGDPAHPILGTLVDQLKPTTNEVDGGT